MNTSTNHEQAGQKAALAYLVNKYPAISHTFILREVVRLRALGMRIEVVSINAPDRPLEELTGIERAEAESTFVLKDRAQLSTHVLTLLKIALTQPTAVIRGLAAWSSFGGWDLKLRLKSIFYLAEALLIGDWMRKRKLDHLHSHFAGAVAIVAMFTAHAFEKEFSFTVHGPDEYMDLKSLHVKKKCDAASFVVTISEFGRAHLLRILGMEARDKVCAVHLGVDLAEFKPVGREHTAEEPVHLVCVGRLVRDKAQDVLLEAMAGLLNRGIRARLTLVGGGAASGQFKALAQSLAMDNHVTFAGALSQPETQAILRTADIFVLPSFAEGIPVALMEAMAMEIPCVSTTVMGIPELITHGQDGLLVRPGGVDDLAAALEAMIASPDLRHRLGKAGRVKVAERFNLDINVPALQRIFARKLSLAGDPYQEAVPAIVPSKVPAA